MNPTPNPMQLTIDRVVIAALCVLSVNCGGQGGDGNAPPSAQVAPTDTAFRIVVTEAGFEAPTTIPSGLRHITFENRGTRIHEAMLVKLASGMSADDYVAAVRAGSLFPKGALDYSGPGLTSPGESTELWVKVDPGEYILICWNNDDATEVPVHRFTVRAEEVNDVPPKADVTVKLADYHFDFEGEFKRGVQVIRFETPGPSMHEADLYRLDDGKTGADLTRWRKDDSQPAAGRAMGGILDSHDVTRVVWLRKNLAPGRYAWQCEMPMSTASSGVTSEVTHADFGMTREFEIK